MKKKIQFIILFVLLLQLTSCNFLDVVPDERVKEEDTYETIDKVKAYLYSCYSYLPSNRDISNNSYWMMCGAETSFYRKELFSTFNEGNYSPSYLHMSNETWDIVWQGIRQCYLFLSIIDKAAVNVDFDVEAYRSEANFLIAYYHFLSLQAYGPTMIIDRLIDQNDPVSDFPERSSYDEVVAFIDKKLDEAMPALVNKQEANNFGRATKFAALALKSRMYLYAASPLFNGNSEMYSNFKSKKDGRHLISQEFSIKKWEKSAEVTAYAIETLTKNGFRLYLDKEAGTPDGNKPSLSNPVQRRLRYSIMDYTSNPEVIFADTREEGYYGIQNRSTPRQHTEIVYDGSGGIAPTLQMVETFYTKNGLPMSVDKTFDYPGRYSSAQLPVNYDGNNYSDQSNGTTLKQHIDREPRFYAWIGFHNGFTETSRYNGKTPGGDDPSKNAIVLHMRNNDEHGRNDLDLYYSVTGYQNKKLIHPAYQSGVVNYPLSLFRMAELYLNYAEALIELNQLAEAKVYIDKVRERAGIPTVDNAWDNYSTQPGYQNTQAGLKEILRQEKAIEFYMEGQKFWDIRRWKIAEQFLGVPDMGLNVSGNTDEEFFQAREVPLKRQFHKGQYLMPIDDDEISKAPQLVQNPYYD